MATTKLHNLRSHYSDINLNDLLRYGILHIDKRKVDAFLRYMYKHIEYTHIQKFRNYKFMMLYYEHNTIKEYGDDQEILLFKIY